MSVKFESEYQYYFFFYKVHLEISFAKCTPSRSGVNMVYKYTNTEQILGLRPANEGRCYIVTPSLIEWVQT